MSPIRFPKEEQVTIEPKFIVGLETAITAVIRERHNIKTTVTKHPIEDGSTITDHVRLNEPTIELSGHYSDVRLQATGLLAIGLELAFKKMERLQTDFELVRVITQQKTYEDMIITDIDTTRVPGELGQMNFVITLEHLTQVDTFVDIAEFFGIEIIQPVVDRGEVMATDLDPETYFAEDDYYHVPSFRGIEPGLRTAHAYYQGGGPSTLPALGRTPSPERIQSLTFERYDDAYGPDNVEAIGFADAITRARCLVEQLKADVG